MRSRSDFPAGFEFGTATSSYQIEGHGFGGAGPTHWDSFAATPGNVARAEDGRRACDHYHRWEEDLDLIQNAGFDAYRFSTSWARVLPEGTGAVNEQGLDFYDRLVDGMLARGIKPAATLYHWELPQALADQGGWRNSEMPNWFAEFTEVVMRRIGDRLHSVAPINEPCCVSWLSHFLGVHAPGLRDIRATARAMHHVLVSHGRAIEVMRGLGIGNLGCVFNQEWSLPFDGSDAAALAAARHDAIFNRFFLEAVFKGRYPDLALEGLEPHLPKGWQEDFKAITQPLDWCGLNYYTCNRLAATDGPWPGYSEHRGDLPKTQLGWEIYPQGLRAFLLRAAQEYTGDLPLFVTENGMASAASVAAGRCEDPDRIRYIADHLEAVHQAIAAGAPVRGYYCWSLLDNYEWSDGYDARFGLVHVDFKTLKRVPKASFEHLREAMRR